MVLNSIKRLYNSYQSWQPPLLRSSSI
jgi:hypothetical protein